MSGLNDDDHGAVYPAFGATETITGNWAFITNDVQFDLQLELKGIAAPGAGAAGYGHLYVKTDGKIYFHYAGGVETDLTVQGGGAPTTASYIVIDYDGTLSAERKLAVDDNTLQLTDLGVNNTITISVDNTMVWDSTDVTLQTTTSGHMYLKPFGNLYIDAGYVQVNSPSGGLVVFIANQTGADHYAGFRIDRDTIETWFIGVDDLGDDLIFKHGTVGMELLTTGQLWLPVVTGTAPFSIVSTTKVANLNVDLLDDQSGAYYLDSANFTGTNWTDLTDTGETSLHSHAAGAPGAHVLATTGPHTGTLPLTDLIVGTRGGIVRRGLTDWEEYALGTVGYVLKAGALDVVWGQVAFSELTGDIVYTQLDSIVDTSGVGTASMISAAVHQHTDADGSTKIGHGNLSGVTSDQHHAQVHGHPFTDITGDIIYTQLDSLVDTSLGGSASMISGAQHVHTDADGSTKISHANLSSVSIDQHHARDHDIEGATHTAAGLTIGHVMRASGAAAFSFAALQAGDIPQLDHGGLGGLGDDDHGAVYPNFGATETISGAWTFSTEPIFDIQQQIKGIAAPGVGPAGYGHLYAKTDGKLYFHYAGGAEVDLTVQGGASLWSDQTTYLRPADSTDGLVIGAATAPDGLAHFFDGSAGAVTADASARVIVAESSGDGGISILTPNANWGGIYFGSVADAKAAWLSYNQSSATLSFEGPIDGAMKFNALLSDVDYAFGGNTIDDLLYLNAGVDIVIIGGKSNKKDEYRLNLQTKADGGWIDVNDMVGTMQGDVEGSGMAINWTFLDYQSGAWQAYFNILATNLEFNPDTGGWIQEVATYYSLYYNQTSRTIATGTTDTGHTFLYSDPGDAVLHNIAYLGPLGVVFNADGIAAHDFRVESLNNANMLFVDAGADFIGIGTATQGGAAIFTIDDPTAHHVDITSWTGFELGHATNGNQMQFFVLDHSAVIGPIADWAVNARYNPATPGWEQPDSGLTSIGIEMLAPATNAYMRLWSAPAGSTTQTYHIRIGPGVQIGSPTGGDKGNGTINAAGDIYKNDSAYINPDFVLEHYWEGEIVEFAETSGALDYQGLMSIQEVAQFTQEKYYLPWIDHDEPSGIFSRGDMLLTGQETLMLYIIQLEERVRELEDIVH